MTVWNVWWILTYWWNLILIFHCIYCSQSIALPYAWSGCLCILVSLRQLLWLQILNERQWIFLNEAIDTCCEILEKFLPIRIDNLLIRSVVNFIIEVSHLLTLDYSIGVKLWEILFLNHHELICLLASGNFTEVSLICCALEVYRAQFWDLDLIYRLFILYLLQLIFLKLLLWL